MKHERRTNALFSATRAMAKMIEFDVPEEYRKLNVSADPSELFTLCIGTLGDIAALASSELMEGVDVIEGRNQLRFSARFFDSFVNSNLNESLDPYLLLLGSASFYLCQFPGSSQVLANVLSQDWLELEGGGLEDLLLWLLRGDTSYYFERMPETFGSYIERVSVEYLEFQSSGIRGGQFLSSCSELRNEAYKSGTPRQLLLADTINAVAKQKHANSTWHSLPRYSGTDVSDWQSALTRPSFIRELWPAQHLLGEYGILEGKSGVIQMPTSAGKTKAVELILGITYPRKRRQTRRPFAKTQHCE